MTSTMQPVVDEVDSHYQRHHRQQGLSTGREEGVVVPQVSVHTKLKATDEHPKQV